MTRAVADDVQSIKELVSAKGSDHTEGDGAGDGQSKSSEAVEVHAAAPEVPPLPPPVAYVNVPRHLRRVRAALHHMASSYCSTNSVDQQATTAAGAAAAASTSSSSSLSPSPPTPFQQGCGALILYVSMVLEHPNVPRYRKIAATNASFRSLVDPLPGHVQVLAAVGFSRDADGGTGGPSRTFEWTWTGPGATDAAGAGAVAGAVADAIADAGAGVGVGAGPNADSSSSVPFPRPADDAGRAAVLSECIRLLQVGKERGAVALRDDALPAPPATS
jgi:PUB domain